MNYWHCRKLTNSRPCNERDMSISEMRTRVKSCELPLMLDTGLLSSFNAKLNIKTFEKIVRLKSLF